MKRRSLISLDEKRRLRVSLEPLLPPLQPIRGLSQPHIQEIQHGLVGMTLVPYRQGRELTPELHEQCAHLLQLHHHDFRPKPFLVLPLHGVFPNRDTRGRKR